MLFMLTAITATAENLTAGPMLLNDPILQIIDGIKGVMDGQRVHSIKYLQSQMKIFQLGNFDSKSKKHIPQHRFQNKNYSLIDLVGIENQVKVNSPEQKELTNLLTKLKEDMINLTRPFKREAQGAEQPMRKLIKAFCNQRRRSDSILLDWGVVRDEEASFRKKVTSFKSLNTFCEDMHTFHGDLLFSCPKAMKQYNDKNKNIRLVP